MKKLKKLLRLLSIACVVSSIAAPAMAYPFGRTSPLTIYSDRGGQVIRYALQAKRMERDNRTIRFSGRCDSACTVYLALPKRLTCVSQGAAFGFHLPYGSNPKGNKVAAQYMMRNYPSWVRNWIYAQGGLTHQTKVMDYSYTSRFLKPCANAFSA